MNVFVDKKDGIVTFNRGIENEVTVTFDVFDHWVDIPGEGSFTYLDLSQWLERLGDNERGEIIVTNNIKGEEEMKDVEVFTHKTIDGRNLTTSEMTTDHLVNTIGYFIRKAWDAKNDFYRPKAGNTLIDKAVRQVNQIDDDAIRNQAAADLIEYHEKLKHFIFELMLRDKNAALKYLKDYKQIFGYTIEYDGSGEYQDAEMNSTLTNRSREYGDEE